MNLTDLKQDFYKRFSSSNNFLSYSRAGLLCPLLGDASIARCAALTCSLSMKVQVYGRKLESDIIKLQNTKNNVCIVFRYGSQLPSQHTGLFEMLEKLHGYGAHGAELFFDCSVPGFFEFERELKTAVFGVMTSICNLDAPISVCGGYRPFYSAVFNARKGYCTVVPEFRELPLPMTGYKFLILQTPGKDKLPRAKYLGKAYERLKRIYPHIHSFADISPDRLEYSKNAVRDKVALNLARHIVDENDRIKAAASGLEKCSLSRLTEQMNLSEESIEKLWKPEKQHVILARSAAAADGVKCAKIWKNGIITIVNEDGIDDITNKIIIDFERAAGYRPYVCIAESFGD